MSRSDYDLYAFTKRAQATLDGIMSQSEKSRGAGTRLLEESVAHAREKPLLEPESDRRTTRVLFITTDTRLLTQATKSLDGFADIEDAFDEVHLMVLRVGVPARHPVLRVANKTWLYTVAARTWWQLPLAAWRVIRRELEFAEGCRFDVVVARDQYESALTAYGAARYYGRVAQLHLPTTTDRALARCRRWLGYWSPRWFSSLRVETEAALTVVQATYPHCPDVAVLPRYRNYPAYFTGEKTNFLGQRYRSFTFFIVYVGPLKETKDVFTAIDVVAPLLRNPRVAFLIIGDGPVLVECERRATLLGVRDRVIFERHTEDLRSVVAGADVMLVTGVDDQSDEIALYGAAAGTPLVLVETPVRQDIFKTGGALIVPAAFPQRLTEAVGRLMNDTRLRLMMRTLARQAVVATLQTDPVIYRESFRDSIEAALLQNQPTDVVE